MLALLGLGLAADANVDRATESGAVDGTWQATPIFSRQGDIQTYE